MKVEKGRVVSVGRWESRLPYERVWEIVGVVGGDRLSSVEENKEAPTSLLHLLVELAHVGPFDSVVQPLCPSPLANFYR